MQESSAPSEHGQQPQRVRARGIPAGVADPYLWQFLYRRHVLREIASGQAGVAGNGTVPPLLPSKDSENLYWLAVGAPSSALGSSSSSSSHNRALCPSNSHGNNDNQRVGGVGNHEIMTFFDQPLLRGSTSCRRILPAPGPPPQPTQVQPVLSRPPASILASVISSAARGNQNGPPGAAGSHAHHPERIRTPPMQEGPIPAEISSQQGGATKDIAPMPAKISSQRGGTAREIAPISAEISSAQGGAAQDRAAASAAAVAAAETNAWRQVEVAELAATATPPPPPPPPPAAASSTATVVASAATTVTSTATATAAAAAGRPQRPMMPGFSYTREVLRPLEAALARSSIGGSPRDSSCAKGVPSREASLLGGSCESKVTSSSSTPRAGTHRSTDPGHQGAIGTAVCEDNSNTVAVRRQRPEPYLRTQSASPPNNGNAAQRRGSKTKRRRLLTSTQEKNASTTNAASKPSRSRRSSRRRPPQPSDSALASRRCHTTVCASCQTPPLEGEHVGLCLCCPRMFCPACLGAVNAAAAGTPLAAGDADADAARLGGGAMVVLDNAALLEAELAGGGAGAPDVHAVGADVSIWQCSLCDHGSDLELPPPPPPPPLTLPTTSTRSKRPQPAHNRDILPKVHLLRELVKHDLSRCFRAPVNVYVNRGYLNAVNRDYMMDLGTMMSKVRGGKYHGDRGAAAFYVDLGRVWDNCRAYAECDRKGRPLVRGNEATVPGIVRCAFALEKMAKKFVHEHIPDDKHPPQWYEQSWNPFPKANPSPNPSQRNQS